MSLGEVQRELMECKSIEELSPDLKRIAQQYLKQQMLLRQEELQ